MINEANDQADIAEIPVSLSRLLVALFPYAGPHVNYIRQRMRYTLSPSGDYRT